MKTVCGVYRITNLKNGKQYIGQSRNIFARWRQHTSNLSRETTSSLIRKAFGKYGLKKTVSSSGIHDDFLFEIIEECVPEMLIEKEYHWIEKEKPGYNIQRLPPNPDFVFQRKPTLSEHFWIQYHNVNKNERYPGHLFGKESNKLLLESWHSISTKKRDVIKSLGDLSLMIVGIGQAGKPKNYFAWSLMTIEELEYEEDIELSFNIYGEQKYFPEPVLLNPLSGFKEFQFRLGNFAFGFQNAASDPFCKTLQAIAKGKFVIDDKLTWRDWIESFEQKYGYDVLNQAG
jgi:group I intron endonuclease